MNMQTEGTPSSPYPRSIPRTLASILLLCLGDAFALLLAGGVGLIVAVSIGNADWPSPEEVLEFKIRERVADFAVAAILWVLWFHVIHNRYLRPIPFWSEVLETTKVAFFMAGVNLAVIALARNDYSRSIWFFGWISLIVLVPVLRTLTRMLLIRFHLWSRPTWIIGCGENAQEARLALQSEWQMGFSILGFLTPGDLNQKTIQGLFESKSLGERSPRLRDVVFVIALDDQEPIDPAALILDLTLAGARSIHMIPSLRGIPLYGADLSYFFSHEVLLLGIRNNLALRFSKVLKMGFDILLTCLLLIPAFPLLLVAGVLIWMEDQGSIFYLQKRVGRHGREFDMLKLRTMRCDAEQQLAEWKRKNSPEWVEYCNNSFKLQDDPRLLKVGHFLRRTSIDELPQLFNVLRGDMSLVGPRPFLKRETATYGKNFVLYQSTRPGMTGLWQVSGRSKTSFQQRATLDAWYIRNWSLAYDILILLRTVVVVFTGRGAL